MHTKLKNTTKIDPCIVSLISLQKISSWGLIDWLTLKVHSMHNHNAMQIKNEHTLVDYYTTDFRFQPIEQLNKKDVYIPKYLVRNNHSVLRSG